MSIWPLPSKLETDRLILRPFTEEDFVPFFAFCRDEKANRYLAFKPEQKTYEGSRETVERIIRLYGHKGQIFTLAVERKWDHRYVGSVGIEPVPGGSDTEIYYTLLPRYWGKGYASESAHRLLVYAFSDLGLTKIVAFIHPHNQPSIRVAQRLKMKDIGFILRKQQAEKEKIFALSRRRFFSR